MREYKIGETLIIGFTGTRQGMNKKQVGQLGMLLSHLQRNIKEVHHGDYVGADAQFDTYVVSRNIPRIVHPPINLAQRAFCKAELVLPEKDFLDRNKDIVNACNILIAAPLEGNEQVRSGTWSTIRYARKLNREIIILER